MPVDNLWSSQAKHIILKYFPLSLRPPDTEYLKRIFPDYMKKTVFHICYNRIGQKISVCDYWKGKAEVRVCVKDVTYMFY